MKPIEVGKAVELGLLQRPYLDWSKNPRLKLELDLRFASTSRNTSIQGFSLPLKSVYSEFAVIGFTVNPSLGKSTSLDEGRFLEIEILGNYFHSHILRLTGNNADEEMLISAKELDCLKWTAEGKTAWEASVILGISERTVRFHLNSAREKMKCATTAQAVAKAVSRNLIAV